MNEGIICAQNFIVNVELCKGSPITVGITKTGEGADITIEVNTRESSKGGGYEKCPPLSCASAR
ncbi:hypothetical protein [Brevibacillus antibioticus]|uniref:hypothetical protein n=1 Tax=Brevibacillus antibioticus TaxID=2570228 RepID=UPI0013903D96|nr:hypothetical protein [Brevibacillus antibioticus]